MKKLISILALILINNCGIYSQCNDVCNKGGGRKNILNERIINLINHGEYLKAIEKLEIITSREGKDYMNKQHIGVGCFYYYYSYAKLALISKKNFTLRDILISKNISLDEFHKEGISAARKAISIIDKYIEIHCYNLLAKIGGNEEEKLKFYLMDLNKILETDNENPSGLSFNDKFKISTVKDNITLKHVKSDNNFSSCIEVSHLFDVASYSNKVSDSINQILKDLLLPILKDGNTGKKITIIITGYSDGMPISRPILYNSNKFKNEEYLNINNNSMELISISNKIRSNEELAFVRAYHAKKSFQDHFNLNNNQILTQVVTKFSPESIYRKVEILICLSDLQLTELENLKTSITASFSSKDSR